MRFGRFSVWKTYQQLRFAPKKRRHVGIFRWRAPDIGLTARRPQGYTSEFSDEIDWTSMSWVDAVTVDVREG